MGKTIFFILFQLVDLFFPYCFISSMIGVTGVHDSATETSFGTLACTIFVLGIILRYTF